MGPLYKKEKGGNTILYFSVFEWPKEGKLPIPGLKNEIITAKLLANGTELKTASSNDGVVISVPEKGIDANATVIKVEVKGMVENMPVKPKE